MDLVYILSAAVGCTALVIQIVLQLIGMDGGDHDVHTDVEHLEGDGNLFFGVLSFKTLTAFFAFFGLGGLAAAQLGVSSGALQLVLALLAGTAAGAVVVVLMRGLARLQSSGTVELDRLVGATARVYLRVPAGNKGAGKVIVQLDGREFEVQATTPGAELPTGSAVEVVRRVEGDTFEVIRP
jgi:hypothetical protein